METILCVGGDFGDMKKESSVLKKIYNSFYCPEDGKKIINGGMIDDLPDNVEQDIVIWMPRIDNANPKNYPTKRQGTVLICSKEMRNGYTDIHAVSRIFKMKANAVIAIYKDTSVFRFRLLDSLGTEWCNTENIIDLVNAIRDFYEFSSKQKRIPSYQKNDIQVLFNLSRFPKNFFETNELIELNKTLSDNVRKQAGNRFFGNLSTRCEKLFPSRRYRYHEFYCSPRNSDKEQLAPEDMVPCLMYDDGVFYYGDKKPSVDAPVQGEIYRNCMNVNFMIHGHAFVVGAKTTSEYFLCGDLNAVQGIIDLIGDQKHGVINLKNHGFLFFGETLEGIKEVMENCEYTYERN